MRKLSFSYSKMGLYKECPQKYKFRYIHKLPEEPKYYFAFGTAMHKVMEFVYGVAEPPFPSLAASQEFFKKDWAATSYKDKGYASAAKEADGFLEGARIINEYYQKNEAAFFVPLRTEMKTTLDMDNLSLISIIDRLDYKGGGVVDILDYKTGKNVDREPQQLYMYQKVVENSPAIKQIVLARDPDVKEVRVGKMSYYHLPSQTAVEFERAPKADMDNLWGEVLHIADEIRAEKFAPTPEEGKCRWCDYKNFCPVFTGVEFGGIKTPRPVVAAPALDAADTLGAKVDLYCQKAGELKALKREIFDEMKIKNLNSSFGKKFVAEVREKEVCDFPDKDAVISFLREAGLIQKTLVPTASTIEKLLTSSEVSAEDKQKLSALIKRTKTEELTFKKAEE